MHPCLQRVRDERHAEAAIDAVGQLPERGWGCMDEEIDGVQTQLRHATEGVVIQPLAVCRHLNSWHAPQPHPCQPPAPRLTAVWLDGLLLQLLPAHLTTLHQVGIGMRQRVELWQ